MKITVEHDDGTAVDITEGVQLAYDIATSSMDWGSGFLDWEEMAVMVALSRACRFSDFEEKLGEVWRKRYEKTVEGMNLNFQAKYELLNEEAKKRGADYWHSAMPTPAERAEFLAQLHRGEA